MIGSTGAVGFVTQTRPGSSLLHSRCAVLNQIVPAMAALTIFYRRNVNALFRDCLAAPFPSGASRRTRDASFHAGHLLLVDTGSGSPYCRFGDSVRPNGGLWR
jgi:hypothetical protein